MRARRKGRPLDSPDVVEAVLQEALREGIRVTSAVVEEWLRLLRLEALYVSLSSRVWP